jgi:hypothetical protein
MGCRIFVTALMIAPNRRSLMKGRLPITDLTPQHPLVSLEGARSRASRDIGGRMSNLAFGSPSV